MHDFKVGDYVKSVDYDNISVFFGVVVETGAGWVEFEWLDNSAKSSIVNYATRYFDYNETIQHLEIIDKQELALLILGDQC